MLTSSPLLLRSFHSFSISIFTLDFSLAPPASHSSSGSEAILHRFALPNKSKIDFASASFASRCPQFEFHKPESPPGLIL
jgi:hypothetical protein